MWLKICIDVDMTTNYNEFLILRRDTFVIADNDVNETKIEGFSCIQHIDIKVTSMVYVLPQL